jgi:hypothetical protein
MWAADSATLGHVRLKHSALDAPVARLRLEYLLASVELRPAAMPPTALLVVRSMRDPLPSRITKKFEAGATATHEWEHAAQFQLATLYRKAGRPARGAVPATSETVVFGDYGELLACFARDSVRGATNSWWWQSVVRRFCLRLPAKWLDTWEEHALYVPAALEQLQERGEAIAILQGMVSAQAWRLLLAILRAANLAQLASIVSQCSFLETAHPPFTAELQDSLSRRRKSEHYPPVSGATGQTTENRAPIGCDSEICSGDEFSVAQAPWEPYVAAGAIAARLDAARRTLLGISLLLRGSPQVAYSATFAIQLRAWLTREIQRERKSLPANTPANTSTFAASANAIARTDTFDSTASETAESQSEAAVSTSAPANRSAGVQFDPRMDFDVSVQHASSPESAAADEGTRPDIVTILETGELTCAAGILYLIHFLREAELMRFDTGLSGWAQLELLARCLLDQSIEDISGDPIWTALALLDGREPGLQVGSGFRPQPTYEAPESWLHGLDTSTLHLRYRSGRMEGWHPEGFLTFDSQAGTPMPSAVFRPLTRSQRRRWRQASRVRAPGVRLSQELRRFLRFVSPYARWRLSKALRGTSIKEVLLRTGMLYVSRTHVDVVMGMREISLAARLAGLDANPGWVPELNRVITFHFEEGGARG